MFLMMAEMMHLSGVALHYPDEPFWVWVGHHTSHVAWTGCSLHDLIQPSFTFLVGVALPFSIASRVAKGQRISIMIFHALWRSLLLILLGVALRSVGRVQTNWTFEDTLSQIGLGYPFLFALGFASRRWQLVSFIGILISYWLAFVMMPAPTGDFNYAAVGTPLNGLSTFPGFQSHWNMNSNLAWWFDTWFLNLFPRESLFISNRGGYATLSFIPTLATMILGLLAGEWLKIGGSPALQLKRLILAGVGCLALGYTIHTLGICPSVKKIWTPSWVLFSGGWCYLLLAGFYLATETHKYRGWAYPLLVIGRNSIAIYCLVHLIDHFILATFYCHLGTDIFNFAGPNLEPMISGMAVLVVFWLILWQMDRNRIYIRI